MSKKNIKLIKNILIPSLFLLLLLTLFTISSKAEITYIENGWMAESPKTTESLLNNYTNHKIENNQITLTKKSGFDSYALTKGYDTSNIPIKYYQKSFNETTGEFDLTLVREEKYNINTKSQQIYNFANNNNYVCQIGFGTITYWGANDRIVVYEQETSLDQIYNTVVTNGWNNFFKIDDDCFIMDCQLFIGNGSGNPSYLNMTGQTLICNSTTINNDAFLQIENEGHLNANECSFILNKNNTNTITIRIEGESKINRCSFINNDISGDDFRLYTTANTKKYINDSSFIFCGVQPLDDTHFNKCIITGSVHGIWSPSSDGTISNTYITLSTNGIYSSGSNTLSVSNISFFDNTYDIRIHNANTVLNLTDCDTNRNNNTFRYSWASSPNANQSRFNTFKLKTDASATVKIYNQSGHLKYDGTSTTSGWVNTTLLVATHNHTLGEYGYWAEAPFTLHINKSGYDLYNKTFDNNFDKIRYEIYLITTSAGATSNMNVSLNVGTELFFFIIWIILFMLCFSPKHDYLINVIAGIFLSLFSLVMFNTYTAFEYQEFLLLSFTISVIAMFSGFLVKKPLKKKG